MIHARAPIVSRFAALLLGSIALPASGAVEPVPREAVLQMSTSSAAFVLPRATTEELAELAHEAGGKTGARWLCDAYAVPPATAPDDVSLRGLVQAAAARGGRMSKAGDAFVHPRLLPSLETVRQLRDAGCIFNPFGGCDAGDFDYWTRISPTLAARRRPATAAERDAFDAADCRMVLEGRDRHARALRFFLTRAQRRGGCLAIDLTAGAGRPSDSRSPRVGGDCSSAAPIARSYRGHHDVLRRWG